MFNVSRKKSFSKVLLALTLLASAVAGAAVQSASSIPNNWTVEDIRRLMADKPIQVPMIYHPAVATELNRFLATDDSRRKFSRALSRMKAFEAQFKEYFRNNRLPTDYVLLPLIESGYQNIDSTSNKSGGMWQFIPETARRFGLRVDEKVDERFDVDKSTGAAVAYLRVLNNLFNDPRLALLSYNLGEKSLQKKLDEMKQKTIEALLETGRLEKEQRLHIARFQAAMVLYYNPELL